MLAREPEIPTADDIVRAATRIEPYIHRTPVVTARSMDERAGAKLFFKCENFQRVGAFKFRGATNAVFSLTDEEATAGVATHSSGNHAQAVALAAQNRGVPAYIVMPHTAPKVKIAAVREYGGEITFCEPTLLSRETTLERVIAATGAAFIHSYDDPRIIAGQATAAKELFETVHDLDHLVAPVGGGGLLSGSALAAHYFAPDTKVVGAEPATADDAYRSLKRGELVPANDPHTIADGLRTSLSQLTFTIIDAHVHRILTVSERAIVAAMRLVWMRMKLVVEPSAVVALAAVLDHPELFAGSRVGVVLSGGNVDLDALPW